MWCVGMSGGIERGMGELRIRGRVGCDGVMLKNVWGW